MVSEKLSIHNEWRILSVFKEGDKKKYPEPYDLVLLLLDDERTFYGWYVSLGQFGGYKIKPCMNVIGWKRVKDY